MWPFSQWTTAGRAALMYVTAGALTVIWSGVWYVYLVNNPPAEAAYYWCTGFLVTGLIMILIGLVLAMVSRAQQRADEVRANAAAAALSPQPIAAPAPPANAVPAAPLVVAKNGQVVAAPPQTVPR